MSTRKPDPSYAIQRLTKTNYTGPQLLSQVSGRPARNVSQTTLIQDERDSSDDPLTSCETISQRGKPEPATDDEPISTADESDHSSVNSILSPVFQPLKRSTWSSKDLEYNLAAGDAAAAAIEDDSGSPKKRRRKSITTPKPREGKRRSARNVTPKASKPVEDNDNKPTVKKTITKFQSQDSDKVFPALASSFRKPTKRKSNVYGSGGGTGFRNIHTTSSKQKPIPKPKFKYPKPTNSDPDSDSRDTAVHSSQVTGGSTPKFKNQTSFPTDVFSGSPMPTTTSSSRDNEYAFDLLDDDPDASQSPLSSVSSSISLSLSPDEKRKFCPVEVEKPRHLPCPMCSEPVEVEFFESYNNPLKGKGVRQQLKFCRAHRTVTAEQEWTEKGYPTIDWDGLQNRIERHFSDIENILLQKKKSFYRNSLESITGANNRGDLRLKIDGDSLDRISSGYYGSKGAKHMMDSIISRFAPNLRKLAPHDSLMQATGVSGFVQSVLVPELTVMLVKEDMNVENDDAARQVMKESMDIGELLNEQPDDIVDADEEG